MKPLFTTLLLLLTLTAFGQQRVIVDSITTDPAKIYYKIEIRTVDTTGQVMSTALELQQQIAVREIVLKQFLEKSIRAQVPLLDSIKNDQARQYAVSQIMAQDNQYATIRQDMEVLKQALLELSKIKKK
jgi:hypothetical protein